MQRRLKPTFFELHSSYDPEKWGRIFNECSPLKSDCKKLVKNVKELNNRKQQKPDPKKSIIQDPDIIPHQKQPTRPNFVVDDSVTEQTQ